MFKRLMERRKEEQGFTLIELMVVVLIIGILIAIALPTFLGARTRAQNRAAQSNLRNGMAAAKVFFTDADTFVGFDSADGETLEPSLGWVGAVDPAVGEVSVTLVGDGTPDVVILASHSASGTYYCIAEDSAVGTTYGQGANWAAVDTYLECDNAAWT